ncbi:nucleotide exchange factor GrpE [Nakamurella aerolata]|uniref:nucleotide exchange factor GrpE n=1 Tax=Nakamurella aerolata TaxID=1656892 RepID=UPI001BB1EE75
MSNRNDLGGDPQGEQDKPFQFTDKRRIDPQTGSRRPDGSPAAGPAGGSPIPGTGGGNPADPAQAGQPLSVSPGATGDVAALQQQLGERTADLQRVTAEYANYRKRVDRDREQVAVAAKSSVLSELLPVLDDIDRAESHGDLTGAFKAVADKLSGVLTKLELESVGAQGEPFDPEVHEAVQFTTSPEVSEPTVTEVLRHGYRISGRLARPAVVVVTGPEHEAAQPAGGGADGAAGPAGPASPDPQH